MCLNSIYSFVVLGEERSFIVMAVGPSSLKVRGKGASSPPVTSSGECVLSPRHHLQRVRPLPPAWLPFVSISFALPLCIPPPLKDCISLCLHCFNASALNHEVARDAHDNNPEISFIDWGTKRHVSIGWLKVGWCPLPNAAPVPVPLPCACMGSDVPLINTLALLQPPTHECASYLSVLLSLLLQVELVIKVLNLSGRFNVHLTDGDLTYFRYTLPPYCQPLLDLYACACLTRTPICMDCPSDPAGPSAPQMPICLSRPCRHVRASYANLLVPTLQACACLICQSDWPDPGGHGAHG